ncbi:MAG: hypothetical protein SPJ80_00010 [Bacilli bacterium]|nr:hypothetical protein [Bacilli bacterium]
MSDAFPDINSQTYFIDFDFCEPVKMYMPFAKANNYKQAYTEGSSFSFRAYGI